MFTARCARSQSVETVPCQGTPARVLAALHSLTALFSPVLRALHTKRVCTVDAAQVDQLQVSQRWLTQQTSLECVAMSQFARHAQEQEKIEITTATSRLLTSATEWATVLSPRLMSGVNFPNGLGWIACVL